METVRKPRQCRMLTRFSQWMKKLSRISKTSQYLKWVDGLLGCRTSSLLYLKDHPLTPALRLGLVDTRHTGALALMAQQHEVVHVIYCQSLIE